MGYINKDALLDVVNWQAAEWGLRPCSPRTLYRLVETQVLEKPLNGGKGLGERWDNGSKIGRSYWNPLNGGKGLGERWDGDAGEMLLFVLRLNELGLTHNRQRRVFVALRNVLINPNGRIGPFSIATLKQDLMTEFLWNAWIRARIQPGLDKPNKVKKLLGPSFWDRMKNLSNEQKGQYIDFLCSLFEQRGFGRENKVSFPMQGLFAYEDQAADPKNQKESINFSVATVAQLSDAELEKALRNWGKETEASDFRNLIGFLPPLNSEAPPDWFSQMLEQKEKLDLFISLVFVAAAKKVTKDKRAKPVPVGWLEAISFLQMFLTRPKRNIGQEEDTFRDIVEKLWPEIRRN